MTNNNNNECLCAQQQSNVHIAQQPKWLSDNVATLRFRPKQRATKHQPKTENYEKYTNKIEKTIRNK